jgi:hypothetical protein
LTNKPTLKSKPKSNYKNAISSKNYKNKKSTNKSLMSQLQPDEESQILEKMESAIESALDKLALNIP